DRRHLTELPVLDLELPDLHPSLICVETLEPRALVGRLRNRQVRVCRIVLRDRAGADVDRPVAEVERGPGRIKDEVAVRAPERERRTAHRRELDRSEAARG